MISDHTHHHISIIGTGKVALALAYHFQKAGHIMDNIYGRNHEKATQMAKQLGHGVQAVSHLNFSAATSNLFFLCVQDDAIPVVAKQLILPPHALLCHTSGSVDMLTLRKAHKSHEPHKPPRVGVFYP